MITITVTIIPPTRIKQSWLARCSISLIVVLERPKVLPISISRLWAPFKVIRCDLKLSIIPDPCCRRLSTPETEFFKLFVYWLLWSTGMSTYVFVVNFVESRASRSAFSVSIFRTCCFQVLKAADKWRLSYFNWSTRIFAFCLIVTLTFKQRISSFSQLLKHKKIHWNEFV